MSGAVIALDQDRPGPSVSAGSPGISRRDLWVGQVIHPRCTTTGNSTYAWTLLDKPRGSTVVLSSASSISCTMTPDVPGSYRLQLVTNGGGPGNTQILTFRVRYDVAGALVNRGWVMPAMGEGLGESNYPVTGGNNVRGYDEPWDFFMEDVLPFVVALPLPIELPFAAGRQQTGGTLLTLGVRKINFGDYPATIGTKTRHVRLIVALGSSDTGIVGTAYLWDRDAAATVTGSSLSNAGAVLATNVEEFSADLTVDASSGNLRSDVEHYYEVKFSRTVGGGADFVVCHNARLIISYY